MTSETTAPPSGERRYDVRDHSASFSNSDEDEAGSLWSLQQQGGRRGRISVVSAATGMKTRRLQARPISPHYTQCSPAALLLHF
uniref:Uncharacterized protein n=1 Tax=Knipowitschia caucasica TaxID=637954 RepID=A0AAV2KX16_KNICA